MDTIEENNDTRRSYAQIELHIRGLPDAADGSGRIAAHRAAIRKKTDTITRRFAGIAICEGKTSPRPAALARAGTDFVGETVTTV
jgi:hypothetical protein